MRINKTYIISCATALLSLGLMGCGDDYPSAQEAPYATDLLSIKILNAGPDGTEVVEGTVDEANRIINFPRIDPATDFSALRVEASVSEGSALEETVYNFSMDEADAFKTLVVRVKNHNRYKDYFMKVRKRIPVYGADFDQPTLYNFSGDHLYADYRSLLTRCGDFDGQHVLVVSRATKPHLLKVSDLKQGKIAPIMLDLTDVSGGTYAYNMGALANGHVYLATLSGAKASPLKIYYWDTPTSKPEVLANIKVADIPDAANRHGDNMSLNIDKNGNGFIFFGDNTSSKILRLTVSNHKTIGSPVVFPSDGNAGLPMTVFRVGDTSEYIWSGLRLPVTLTDESVSPKYTMVKGSTVAEGVAARVFTFNNSRYLMMCPAAHGSTSKAIPGIYVYDISKGATVEEALANFDKADDHNPVYTFYLGGSGNGAGIAQTNYYIEKGPDGKDMKLYLFASRADSGFAFAEFPIKKSED
ncbi:DUF4623 domain-containing protein [Prevotella sp.]|uniref:DUF4623 domain-containing protein n=1 Tax=Prevotella sp. TaxID=59823 RepID=UPI002F92FB9E